MKNGYAAFFTSKVFVTAGSLAVHWRRCLGQHDRQRAFGEGHLEPANGYCNVHAVPTLIQIKRRGDGRPRPLFAGEV
jgi:hypothetical protein